LRAVIEEGANIIEEDEEEEEEKDQC